MNININPLSQNWDTAVQSHPGIRKFKVGESYQIGADIVTLLGYDFNQELFPVVTFTRDNQVKRYARPAFERCARAYRGREVTGRCSKCSGESKVIYRWLAKYGRLMDAYCPRCGDKLKQTCLANVKRPLVIDKAPDFQPAFEEDPGDEIDRAYDNERDRRAEMQVKHDGDGDPDPYDPSGGY